MAVTSDILQEPVVFSFLLTNMEEMALVSSASDESNHCKKKKKMNNIKENV